MEHISREIGKDPLEVRLANLDPADNNTMKELIEDLKSTSDYDMRKGAVASFNGVRLFQLVALHVDSSNSM